MTSAIHVTAVMPCLNEEKTLKYCIDKAQRAFQELGIVGEVVIADNGSTDGSAKLAKDLGARVVHEPRKGYGAALMAGVKSARGRVIVMADADDSYDWSNIGDFIKKIDAGHDFVIGNRFAGGIEPGAMPPLHRYLGNPLLSFLARRMYRIPIGDFHCGMRAFTREAFQRMALRTPGMEFATEMVINASHAGLRIAEIPIRLYPDKRDRPPHLRSFRDGWRHLRFMMTYAPDFLYILPGGLLTLSGLLGMATLVAGPATLGAFTFGIHFLALSSMLTLLGANITAFGLFARTLHAARKPIRPGSLFGLLLRHFTLERGIVAGAVLFLGGMAVDMWIFTAWLARNFGNMDDTVHPAFAASTIMVLGINIIFAAFLFNMIREERV